MAAQHGSTTSSCSVDGITARYTKEASLSNGDKTAR